MFIDVFNGDADGICALHQLRLAEPVENSLVTGVKRDINLLQRVSAGKGDKITVLDVSLDKNREALVQLLGNGAVIQYFDHHFAGDIPLHENLEANIDTAPNTCTSLLVNEYLHHEFSSWAVVAAYGDNLYESANITARPLQLVEKKLEQLRILGTCINYNGYGSSLDDLFYHPADLYSRIKPYADPFEFIAVDEAFKVLNDGYNTDMAQAESLQPESVSGNGAVYILPDEKWARRVSGVYSNDLAQSNQGRAHAVLTCKNDGYQVSVRAPLKTKTGADTLCRQFETGGGRQAAAGINLLPQSDLEKFIKIFQGHFAR